MTYYSGLDPLFVVFLAVIFGLIIGSFLNVVIYRLPLQMAVSWRRDSLDFLGLEPEPEPKEKQSIAYPPSYCPKCNQPIKPWHNIPFFSYLLLKGRCENCTASISLQYPIIELLCAILTGFVAYHFGLTFQCAMVLLLTWALIALMGIDFNEQLLPDNITLPLLWLGLLLNISGTFVPLQDAVIGAAAGYLVFWSIFWIFKLITGKEGMGHGDFKLLAVLGAWAGWQMLPLIVLLSSLVGAIIGVAAIAMLGRDKQLPIPFGPYLAIAGWIALLWGEQITQQYLALL